MEGVDGIVAEEGSHQRQYEEGQPTDRERAHDDAERRARLPFLRQLEA